MPPYLRGGDRGPAVAAVRSALHTLGLLPVGVGPVAQAVFDDQAVFDEQCDRAVREFQQRRGLTVDGRVGAETFRALEEARWRLGDRPLSYAVSHPLVGDDVAALQERLLDLGFAAGRLDGVFGPDTERALRDFQRNIGLEPDGICGPLTLRGLRQLSPRVRGGRPQWMRETEALYRAGPTLVGKTVVVDPGHGGRDRGASVGGVDEHTLVSDLAARLEGRLIAAGVTTYLSHGPDRALSDLDRATFANSVGANLVLSLHIDAAPTTSCEGVATYYYGTGSGAASTVGERLAGLVQREVVARTGLVDGRTHAKTWDLLRGTRMPTVRLELGYLTNPGDCRRLAHPGFRDRVAEAVLVAVQRLYLPANLDPGTGRLPIPASLAG